VRLDVLSDQRGCHAEISAAPLRGIVPPPSRNDAERCEFSMPLVCLEPAGGQGGAFPLCSRLTDAARIGLRRHAGSLVFGTNLTVSYRCRENPASPRSLGPGCHRCP
jgi:hypothetical protein